VKERHNSMGLAGLSIPRPANGQSLWRRRACVPAEQKINSRWWPEQMKINIPFEEGCHHSGIIGFSVRSVVVKNEEAKGPMHLRYAGCSNNDRNFVGTRRIGSRP